MKRLVTKVAIDRAPVIVCVPRQSLHLATLLGSEQSALAGRQPLVELRADTRHTKWSWRARCGTGIFKQAPPSGHIGKPDATG